MTRPDDPLLDWTEDGAPRSRRFGDVYFSREDGAAESRAVFLQGCGLPEAWADRRRFTVGEIGFGTGLNVLVLLDLWRRTRPEGGRLHVFSVEAFPLSAAEAERAHAARPELADLAAALRAAWPQARGFHRIDLPHLHAVVDVAVDEAAAALKAWSGAADAWFLDGFAPAADPAIWRQEVLDLVAARSAPGARVATYTVAGAVRRGLEAACFRVEKRPGFGRKRERLEAVLPGEAAPSVPAPFTAVIGAGIAGAALARALRAEGCEVVVIDPEGPGAGASGAPAALIGARLDAGGGPVAALFAQALTRAAALIEATAPQAFTARGLVQLEAAERDAARFDRVAAQPTWPPGAMKRLDPAAASERLGEPVARGGLLLRDGGAVEPRALLDAWLADTPVRRARVSRLEPVDGAWRLLDADGGEIARAQAVVLACGAALPGFVASPIRPVRGQVTHAPRGLAPGAAAWGGYLAPARTGFVFGATHDRDEAASDARPADDARNLATLSAVLPALAAGLDPAELEGRAAVRATTPDRLPLCGPIPERPGLYVLGGLGSRGFLTAPLLAEHLAALIAGAPSPLPGPAATLVDPARYAVAETFRP